MGLFSKPRALLNLKLYMDFNLRTGLGAAATVWDTMDDGHPNLYAPRDNYALIALLYGRTLSNHAPTRVELFNRMGDIASKLITNNPKLEIEDWRISVAGISFTIWPWKIIPVQNLKKPKIYSASLLEAAHNKVRLDLKMALGQEKILSPSAPLLALDSIAGMLSASGLNMLGQTLLAMNDFYGSPKKAKGFAREGYAIDSAIRSVPGLWLP